MYRKIHVTASEMLEMRKQGMSNHDIAKSLDISPETVRRYIGKQGERMENLAAFADHPTRQKTEKEFPEMAVVPKYDPKPVLERFVIGDCEITMDADIREISISSCGGEFLAAYDDIPQLVQFLAWAMRERMDVM